MNYTLSSNLQKEVLKKGTKGFMLEKSVHTCLIQYKLTKIENPKISIETKTKDQKSWTVQFGPFDCMLKNEDSFQFLVLLDFQKKLDNIKNGEAFQLKIVLRSNDKPIEEEILPQPLFIFEKQSYLKWLEKAVNGTKCEMKGNFIY